MGWRGILCSSFFLFTLVSSTRVGDMWPLNLSAESAAAISWPILSASMFVLVALFLSMYLIFEHLAAYNQPEVWSQTHVICCRELFALYFDDPAIYLLQTTHRIPEFILYAIIIFLFIYFRSRSFWSGLFWWFLFMHWNQYGPLLYVFNFLLFSCSIFCVLVFSWKFEINIAVI